MYPSATNRAKYAVRVSAGTARKRASSWPVGASASLSERIQYIAWRTSSRILRYSSSSISRQFSPDVGDRGNRGPVGREVERGPLGPLGLREALVERHKAREVDRMPCAELPDRLHLALVAHLVSDQCHSRNAQVAAKQGHAPTGLER